MIGSDTTAHALWAQLGKQFTEMNEPPSWIPVPFSNLTVYVNLFAFTQFYFILVVLRQTWKPVQSFSTLRQL